VVGGWWLVVGGWWLGVGGWWLVVGGWWLVVGDGVAGDPCTGSGCLRTGQFVTFASINNINMDTEPQANNARWAYADLVPGPLPLFGVAAAFGFSRKLRKRINDSKAAGSSFPAS
jgi:hypothetical protein